MTKRSPPMPPRSGSTTPSAALAVMAASTALPPRASTIAPACEASVWLVATIPRSDTTIDRACDRSCDKAVGASRSNKTHFIRLWIVSHDGPWKHARFLRGIGQPASGLTRVDEHYRRFLLPWGNTPISAEKPSLFRRRDQAKSMPLVKPD